MIFWDVDSQVDFLSPFGRLYIPGAERIIPHLRLLTEWAMQRGCPIISSACAHQSGDPELETYGRHCMAGTPGQQKIPETLVAKRFVVPNRPIELPDLRRFQQIIIEKQAFDFATNPNAEKILRHFGSSPAVALYGVASEICVAAAARSLLRAGWRVRLIRDAVAELDPVRAEAFFIDFVEQGGHFIRVQDVITSSDSRAA
jgi:nicotinamidase/pyrazinamidase